MVNIVLDTAWSKRLSHYEQVVVGFSGGLDSTVLLHLLASYPQLKNKIIAVHVHHGISRNASDWQKHCERLCANLGVGFITQSVLLKHSSNIEEEARKARYAIFAKALNNRLLLEEKQNAKKRNSCLVLGHHQDDQAETVLLHLFRGAGIDGLSAMSEIGSLDEHPVYRPLLAVSRKHLEQYASTHELSWIEDESNNDMRYSRNFLRQKIIPLLQTKWPSVTQTIARTAKHCQQAKICLDALAKQDSSVLSDAENVLPIEPLLLLNNERMRNTIRAWIKRNTALPPSTVQLNRIVHEVVMARMDAVPEVQVGTSMIRRFDGALYCVTENSIWFPKSLEWLDFPNDLHLVPYDDMPLVIVAKQSKTGLLIPKYADIQVRFRQGGEEFVWRGQTKQLKKLFQEWSIPPWIRGTLPLVYINDKLAAIPGYAMSDLFYADENNDDGKKWVLAVKAPHLAYYNRRSPHHPER